MPIITTLLCLFALTSPMTQAGELTYEDVVELIQKNHVLSIEQLLPKLPEEFRSNYTLMYSSRSLQDASYEHPRVIMFGNDARLTCAFNGEATQLGFDML